MNKILIWLKITRPHTLFASISPVAIGLIAGAKTVDLDWVIAIATFLGAISIQILSNMVNDFYDYKKGLDKKGRIGFKRALAEGDVTQAQMKKGMFINLLISSFIGLYLIYHGGVIILLIGLLSVFFAWLYTATSKSLSYLGIADIFCFVFFGPVATIGTTYLQTMEFSSISMFWGFICGALATCVLIVNNIRDIENDKLENKKTFVVRFGKRAGELEYLFFISLTLVFSLVANGFAFSNLIFIFGLILFLELLKTNGLKYNRMLIKTGFLNVIFVILILVDFIL